MDYDPVLEECVAAVFRAVYVLVYYDNIADFIFFLHAAAGGSRYNQSDAELLQGIYIRAIGYVCRINSMASAVTSQERNLMTVQLADDDVIRRHTERRFDDNLRDVLEVRHRIKAAAPDDADIDVFHATFQLSNLRFIKVSCSKRKLAYLRDVVKEKFECIEPKVSSLRAVAEKKCIIKK